MGENDDPNSPWKPQRDGSLQPVLIMNNFMFMSYLISDPEIIKALMNMKYDSIDKAPFVQENLRFLLGETFLFSPATALWKKKRQACSHAFYKDRLIVMANSIKQKFTNKAHQYYQ